MVKIQEDLYIDRTSILRMENDFLQMDIAPSVGGRITSLIEKASGYEFLWRNPNLRLAKLPPYSEYDPNFYGGIDELLPNDIPESLNGVQSPDHGELWTTSLDYRVEDDGLVLFATLPLSRLTYERRMMLRSSGPYVDIGYRIGNPTGEQRTFLWKLHAALAIEAGDRIVCPARTAQVVDLDWSRWYTLEPFAWPFLEQARADRIPARNGTMDFFYLYDLEVGRIGWHSNTRGLMFEYHFDMDVFPYAWYFASYGGFDGHYVAVLEPCTTMPLSVNEAAQLGQCTVLAPGEEIKTQVTIYAGPLETS